MPTPHNMAGLFERTLGIVAVRSNPAGRKSKGQFSPTHEYALFSVTQPQFPELSIKRRTNSHDIRSVDKKGRFAWNIS